MKRKSFTGNSLVDTDDTISPQITSLIDAMTILLVFLIQNFSTEGNLITTQKDIVLPYSEVKTTPLPAYTVQITSNEVRVQGVSVVKNENFENRDDLIIPELFEKLSKNEPDKRIIIEADKNLPFNIIKRVCFSCSAAGFENFEILVDKDL
ncbi:MAG: biopolymer transporter ExbD [Chitinispirillales bacterium]|jgi:biopolymer transport protein ExbD|nr:biopolymer transporter ExbD [Chitinispirillales bacterium]